MPFWNDGLPTTVDEAYGDHPMEPRPVSSLIQMASPWPTSMKVTVASARTGRATEIESSRPRTN